MNSAASAQQKAALVEIEGYIRGTRHCVLV